MPVYALADRTPTIDPTAYVHPDAVVIGSVVIGPEASVWPGAVLRGDYGDIEIGERTSIQDGTVIHATPDLPTVVHGHCVIGHIVHLEGCTVGPWALVGSGSVVLHRAVVHPDSIVGANAVVGNGVEVPTGAMALGVPAKMRLDVVNRRRIEHGVKVYVENGRRYREQLRRLA